MASRIRVLIVDDSAVVRSVLTSLLSQHPDIDVMGVASDPVFAISKMKSDWPDVIILDMEMPRMDGITFLKKVMNYRPTPVIVCSSLTREGSGLSIEALAAGAVSIFTKPQQGLKDYLQSIGKDLADSVRAAAASRPKAVMKQRRKATNVPSPSNRSRLKETTEKVIAIGTSTGGTQALEFLLRQLPVTTHGIVIVQHMPEKFTAAFAARLNSICELEVREAVDGDRVRPGVVLIAPGGQHMQLKRSGAYYLVSVRRGPLVNHHCPSVDVLFKSVAQIAGSNATGFILTGMGGDGARGLKLMQDAGAVTYAQNEESCVVFGMPKEAIKLGGVTHVVDLQDVPALITRYSEN